MKPKRTESISHVRGFVLYETQSAAFEAVRLETGRNPSETARMLINAALVQRGALPVGHPTEPPAIPKTEKIGAR